MKSQARGGAAPRTVRVFEGRREACGGCGVGIVRFRSYVVFAVRYFIFPYN